MNTKFKNQRGVAILIVVSIIGILTTVVMDFFSESLRNNEIVTMQKARVQAYYLAKSAASLSRLVLLYSKNLESQISKTGVDLSQIGYQPLYKMVPLSSNTLRGLMGGEEESDGETDENVVEDDNTQKKSDATEETDEETGETEEEDESLFDDDNESMGLLKSKEAQDFLSFAGDFEADISEEESKYSLNAISGMSAGESYDMYKKILLSILKREDFKNFFHSQDQDAEKLTHALADYVDSNDTISEFDKVERGDEGSLYSDYNDFKVKNAKYLSLSEIRLVAGMSDDIYKELEPLVTVYNTSDTVNVCLADERIVDALIIHYTTYAECTTPLDADDTEKLQELRDAALAACPDKSDVATALNQALGLQETTTEDTSDSDDETTTTAETAETKSTSSKVSGCEIQFEDLITDSNSIFLIKSVGTVNEVNTTITQVLDTSGSKASAWKIMYYHVE